MGPKVPFRGEGTEGMAQTGTAAKVDGEVHHPSLEMLRGEGQDVLQCLLTNVVVEHPASLALCVGISKPGYAGAAGGRGIEETGATNATRCALSASGLAALASAPPSMSFFAESLVERWIVVPFVELSTRYTVL